MQILLNIVILLVGFAALIKGADYFVDGSAGVAKRFKVPSVIIGLTIVAMGTSAPELAVSVSAGLAGSNEIAVSNVVGSNLFNLLMVLGICAVMKTLPVDAGIKKRDFPFSLVITLLVGIFTGNLILAGKCPDIHNTMSTAGTLSRWNGLVLIAIFIGYMMITIRAAKKNPTKEEEGEKLSLPKSLIFIACGLVAIIVGGQLVVNSAKFLALSFGMSETLVGLTIVAIGTSLPELVTSIVAASKGQNGMAVGNVVGSNIFNLLLILGVSSTIHPIPVTVANFMDMVILLAVSLIAFGFCYTGKKLGRAEGAIMIAIYIGYTAYAIMR